MLLEANEIIEHVIDRFEGHKYTNYPEDRGGPTKYGITLNTYKEFTGKFANEKTIKDLTKEQAIDVYKRNYWDRSRIGMFNEELRHLIYDMCVHHGTSKTGSIIQQLCNSRNASPQLKVDGIIGSKTINEVNSYPPMDMYTALLLRREQLVRGIAKLDPSQKKFLRGWLNRINWFKEQKGRPKKGLPKAIVVDVKAEKEHTGKKPGGVKKALFRLLKPAMKGIIMKKFLPFVFVLMMLPLGGCLMATVQGELGEKAAQSIVKRGNAYCELDTVVREEFRQRIIDMAAENEDGLFVMEVITCKQDLPAEE